MAPLAPESVSPRDILGRLAGSASAHINPTRTLSEVASEVLPRQAVTTTVVSESDGGGNKIVLSGGAIAGIVIGSIVGFLLLLWVIRSCTNLGRSPTAWGDAFEPKHEKPVTYSNRHSHPYHHEAHRSRSRHSRRGSHSHSHNHSHGHSHSHSPRRSVEVRPVYYEGGGSRGRSPRAPPAAYTNGGLDGRDLRKSSGSRNYRY